MSIAKIGSLTINNKNKNITYNERAYKLSEKTFDVFSYLASNHHKTVFKEELINELWEKPELVTPSVIEVAIKQIKQKIDIPLNIKTIEKVSVMHIDFVI